MYAAYHIGTLTIKHTTIALKPIRARERERDSRQEGISYSYHINYNFHNI